MQITDARIALYCNPLCRAGGVCSSCPIERGDRRPAVSDLPDEVLHENLEVNDLVPSDTRLQSQCWDGRERRGGNHLVIGVQRVVVGKLIHNSDGQCPDSPVHKHELSGGSRAWYADSRIKERKSS
jgi:hypothetical protein